MQVLDMVRGSIDGHCLLDPGETVVVGVSGGPDSLCLLHVLCRLGEEYRLTLHVAHLHHGLRGADADLDANFVRELAADWNLSCTVEQVDIPALARTHRLSTEEAARRARYMFLIRVAETVKARTIAVGHNADDQAETVLMHWLRGSGLVGLRGMLPLTTVADYRLFEEPGERPERGSRTSRLRLIRPLLQVTRAEVEAYCDYYGLEPHFDRSNLDTTYFRNWLRHEVLPLLARHNPNVREVIRRSARVMADDYALLRTVLEDTWPHVVTEETPERVVFSLEAWRRLPTSLQRSTLREAIHRLRRSLRNINFLHVENALFVARDGTTGDQATLPRGLMLEVGYETLTFADAHAAQPLPDWPLLSAQSTSLSASVPGTTFLPGASGQRPWRLEAVILARRDLPVDWASNPNPWGAFLDSEAVGDALWLRIRQAGDRFQPQGMGGHMVKLADFLTNQKVPRHVRDRLPLLVGEGKILWVCGHRIDDRARVRDRTTRVLALHFRRGQR